MCRFGVRSWLGSGWLDPEARDCEPLTPCIRKGLGTCEPGDRTLRGTQELRTEEEEERDFGTLGLGMQQPWGSFVGGPSLEAAARVLSVSLHCE